MSFFLHQHRKAYRACVKALGMSDDDRRTFNVAMTGHPSSSDFTERDWRHVVARLQQLAGRPGVEPGQPHLRGQRPVRSRDLPYPLDCGARPEQVGLLEGLKRQFHWKDPDPDHGLRQLIRKRAWPKADAAEADAWLARGADLYALDRKVIACAIRILQRMVDAQTPRSDGAPALPREA